MEDLEEGGGKVVADEDERVMNSVRRCRYIATEETGGAYRLGTSAPSLHEDKRGGRQDKSPSVCKSRKRS